MCEAIAVSVLDFPAEYLKHPSIVARITGREGGDQEVQFYHNRKPFPPLLPVLVDEQFRLARWGNRQRYSNMLPATACITKQELEQGIWRNIEIQEAIIVADAALDRGVWYEVLEGIRGFYLLDEKRVPTVFMLVDVPTDYYRIMTKSHLMPVLKKELI